MLQTKFQPNIPSHFKEMDLNAIVDLNFLVCRKLSNGDCGLIPLQSVFFFFVFFFILITININILLILHTKIQPNIPCHPGENDDFNSNGGHLDYRPDYILLF